MGKTASKIYKVVTLIFGVAVLVCAIFLMATGAGLQEELDFGAGAYYYADIPEFQKYLAWDTFKESLPYWVYVILFLVWGVLMYMLWKWIDRRKR
ncbi:MAG TPA: hypothetical protein DHU72_01935 [Rikenellaceae bacterium]|mgnify:CR=1 FL=1|nr:hypothetical protein [Rikenellaceae bacterium]HCZ22245.1 hypothetical protein [Rikenellaceae bacterium]